MKPATYDAALARFGRIVHGADFRKSAGLRAIRSGFPEILNKDDAVLEQALFLYDSLCARLKRAALS